LSASIIGFVLLQINENQGEFVQFVDSYLLKLTVFCCHAESKAKHPALTVENGNSSWARFFASLRCAQNDKLLYVLVNRRIATIDAIESVSLSYLIT